MIKLKKNGEWNVIIAHRSPTKEDKVNYEFWIDISVDPYKVYQNQGDKWIAR